MMKNRSVFMPFLLVLLLLLSVSVKDVIAASSPGDSLHAVKYVIELHQVDMTAKTITAATTISLTPLLSGINTLRLQLLDLTVDSLFVDQAEIYNYSHQQGMLDIPLAVPANVGDTLDVKVYYHGLPFHESWGGFHFSGSYAFNLGVGISSIPHNLGKAWFPCIDDFTDRALYEVRATVPLNMTAVGGGELLEVVDNGNGTHTFSWYIDNPIPTYLVSVAIGEYSLIEDLFEGIERDIPITYYVRPVDTSKVYGSFVKLKDIAALFEESFGLYDWHRIGYTGTAIGAMEHATNIAYPHFCITGNNAYESLYAHELSHMWFGNKVTCDKAEEMWINEGWATFCQYYYAEQLYGAETYKTQMRDVHSDVLVSCHIEENGYHPLNDIPQEYTYGTSAYDKGATVVQAMRAYLGDSLFFAACKSFLSDLAFTSVSSYDMEASFTANTGVDMNGFFNNWVYHGGTPHYSIDSFSVIPHMGTSEVTVYLKQKRKGPAFTGSGNIIEVSMMDGNWNLFTDTVLFSGQTGSATKILPFYPLEVFLDLEERYFDATVDNYKVLKETGENNFPDTYFNLNLTGITDSAFVQVTHNFAPPDTFAVPVPGLRLSDYRYWTIRGILPETFSSTGRFFYSKSNLDNTLILSQTDSVVIFYRENAGMEWQAVDFSVVGVWSIGYFYVENLQMGDYTLGVWDISVNTGNEADDIPGSGESLRVYPNPSTGIFNFHIDSPRADFLEIYTISGQLVSRMDLAGMTHPAGWDPGGHQHGTYIALLMDNNRQVLGRKKMLYIP
jgi:hypothetical protein